MPKVLVLTRYQCLGASSRVRFLQALPMLEERGFEFDIRPLLGNDYIQAIYSDRRPALTRIIAAYFRRFIVLLGRGAYDLIWLEKEALPWFPAGFENLMLRGIPYVVDLDDAWFLIYDAHRNTVLRWLLGGKIESIMRRSTVAAVGNEYLGARARSAGAGRVEIIPSSIDLERYPVEFPPAAYESSPAEPVIIGWIGTPNTVRYLSEIEPALRNVLSTGGAKLRVVGDRVPSNLADLASESLVWTESTEIEAVCKFDIGIMPLTDGEWEKGKCGYKLLQVMAAARPIVASAVGANVDIVRDGVNGFLAASSSEWITALKCLIENPILRRRMGLAARRTVEDGYSLAAYSSKMGSALMEAARPINGVAQEILWSTRSRP